MNKEFNELMFTKKEGRMLEQLTVRDYELGTSLPIFSNVGRIVLVVFNSIRENVFHGELFSDHSPSLQWC